MAFNSDKKTVNGEIQKVSLVAQKNGSESSRTPVLGLVDTLLSIFVVTPLVVACWRGSWGFMDLHAKHFPNLPCFLIGMIIHIVLAVGQEHLHSAIIESDEKHWGLKIVSQFLRRLYTYLFLTITILHWRGGWGLMDTLTNAKLAPFHVVKAEGSQWFLILWIVCTLVLIAIKGLRNAIAAPFAICIDKSDYVFKFPTMFQRKSRKSVLLSAGDATFSVVILGNLVVIFWRGLWGVIDIVLLPDRFVDSQWLSLVLGLIIVGFVFRLQNCVKGICSICRGWRQLAIADSYIFLSCVATVLYWRGVWALINIYLLPDNVELSCLLSHFVGFMTLVIVNCSNTMLVRGVYIDGKESDGECVVFPCHYLRIILNKEEEFEESDASESDIESNRKILENDENVTKIPV